MSNGNRQVITSAAPTDDPLVITSATFREPVDIGSHGTESWSIDGGSAARHHLKTRLEVCHVGLYVHYRAGSVYRRITIYASNIKSVSECPLSQLTDAQRESWNRIKDEVKR